MIELVLLSFLLRSLYRKDQLAHEAMDDFYDLKLWILAHLDDCTMSDQKWSEMLPICRFADERFQRRWRELCDGEWSNETLVRRIIGKQYEENASV